MLLACHCQYILRCINKVERKEENPKLYDRLSKDKRYKNVEFNPETGALKATHVGHNDGKGEGFILEKKLVDLLYSQGICFTRRDIASSSMTSKRRAETAMSYLHWISLCLYFDNPTMFAPEKITKGYYYMVSNTRRIYLKHIVCVINSAKGIEIKTFDFK